MTKQLDKIRIIKSRDMNFLSRELAVWQEDALISQAQAQQIQKLYSVQKRSFVRVLLVVGAVLVGLGGISFIAANWLGIPRVIRLATILTGYIVCMALAFGYEIKYPRTSRALLLLAAFVYGAGIFLVAQMYHYGGHWSSAIFWWIIGLFPMLFFVGDSLQLVLVQLLSLLYLIGQDILTNLFYGGGLPLSELMPPIHIIVLALALWLAWFLIRGYTTLISNVLLTLLILASRLTLCFQISTVFIILTIIGFILSQFSSAFAFQGLQPIGILLLGLCGLPLTFSDVWEGAMLTNILAMSTTTLSIISAILLGVALLWRLYSGQSMGGVLFALLLCRWFFDKILSFMSRAIGFTSIGIILLALGIVLEWRKRHNNRGNKS